jgi:hypothetical protein
MRLTVTAGGATVDIRMAREDLETLTAAEQTAVRLLEAAPDPAQPPDPRGDLPFGFSVSSDTERAPEPEFIDSEE